MLPLLALLVARAADEPPALLQQSPAFYPEEARTAGAEGTVELLLTVDTSGAVREVELLHAPHPALGKAALEAARNLVFLPASRNGEPVETQVHYRYVFNLGSYEEGGIPRPATLHARVTATDGEPLAGATITAVPVEPPGETLRRSSADSGRVTLPFLSPGRWTITVTHPGYESGVFTVELGPGETLDTVFTLPEQDALEVVVWADRRAWREVDRGELVADPGTVTGVYTLTRRDIESTPGSLEDVARATHALPGVVSDGDLLAGFHVRGGEQDEVVFLLDRVPLENPFHLAGFNSLFNPDMIEQVHFYAGAAPAEVPSATSAVMDVTSWDGAPREPGGGMDGAVDLSASSARALLMGPLDDQERLTIALAARRTYMEGYLKVLQWANVLDAAFAAPAFSELSARAAWRPTTRTRLMVSALRTADSLALLDSEDDAMVNFEGAFELDNSLTMLTLDHRYTTPSGASLQTTLARTWDSSYQRRDLAGTVERSTRLARSFLRTDAVVPFGSHGRLKLGGDLSRFQVASTATIEDTRLVPSWTQAGIANLGLPSVDVENRPAPWTEANAYLQTEVEAPLGPPLERGGRHFQPAVKLRAGLRFQYAGLTGETLPSPRAGLAIPLPTGTSPKLSLGHYRRVIRDPFMLAPGYGNPSLRAEQARHLVVGVDQGVPLPGEGTGGLIRVEVYRILLSDLVVKPDVAGVEPPFSNAGSGENRGVDVMLAARMGRFNGQLAYGYLRAIRENPTHTRWPTRVAPPQDQRHTLSVAADYQLFAHWRTTARYSFHTGRPISRVEVADPDARTVRLSCLNCERLGPTHQIDLRAEWRRTYPRYRLTFYAEILNVGNIPSDFLPIHDVVDGALNTTMLRHLPMRPFLGLRADF